MKKIFQILSITCLSASIVFSQSKSKKAPTNNPAKASSAVYNINTETSTIKWIGKKVTGEHSGLIKAQVGTLSISNSKISSGTINIDMNSITCTDIEDAKSNGDLVGHLKNEDFFNTVAFPMASLTIKKVNYIGRNKAKVIGTLTIKDITLPIQFDITNIVLEGASLSAEAKIKFDRTKYNIKYSSGILGTAKDRIIYDDVNLEVKMAALKN